MVAVFKFLFPHLRSFILTKSDNLFLFLVIPDGSSLSNNMTGSINHISCPLTSFCGAVPKLFNSVVTLDSPFQSCSTKLQLTSGLLHSQPLLSPLAGNDEFLLFVTLLPSQSWSLLDLVESPVTKGKTTYPCHIFYIMLY